MALIKSISGIRGTIGGQTGSSLTPVDIARFTAAYARWVTKETKKDKVKIVLGRDARISGQMVKNIVLGTLQGCGCDVVDIDLATTPTTEIAVINEKADGGIILTASHNPRQWNALKLLTSDGEFLNAVQGASVLEIAEKEDFYFPDVDFIGNVDAKDYSEFHINQVLNLKLVDCQLIKNKKFRVGIDAVNSVGAPIIPSLLRKLGVDFIEEINCTPDGEFAHTPEPLPENLIETSKIVKAKKLDLCFVVDPDADRLAIINEDGTMFGEEYSLVSIADFVLSKTPGNTVSNMSSSMALRDITLAHSCEYSSSAVGEVNVVSQMKTSNAIIGGEGNGGIIYPEAHYGRDALVGIALFLTLLAEKGCKCSELRRQYPDYHISKNKITLSESVDVDAILKKVTECYSDYNVNTIDGVKITMSDKWVHLRKSNTEPIIRIYSEAKTENEANALAEDIKKMIGSM
ncbi:MAG: phosphoglucosamine mutase [Bacteroidales bacterium]